MCKQLTWVDSDGKKKNMIAKVELISKSWLDTNFNCLCSYLQD